MKAEERIVEMVFRYKSGDVDGFAKWLEDIGGRVVERKGDMLIFDGPSGIRTGIHSDLDPITIAVCLGFAIAGMFWPFMFPRLTKKVDRKIKERR